MLRPEGADFADGERRHRRRARGRKTPTSSTSASRPVPIARIFIRGCEPSVDDPHERRHAAVRVVPGVEEERLQRRVRIALRRRDVARRSARGARRCRCPAWPRSGSASSAGMPTTCSICSRARSGSADGRSILLMTGTIIEVVVDREVGVGERLRLDALRRVHDEHGALAGGERARDLVGEVDVARACRSGSACTRGRLSRGIAG